MERQTAITVTSAEMITLRSPKGTMALRWDGSQLIAARNQPLRLTAEKTAEIAAAVATARTPVIETKRGYQITDGNRDGWTYVGVEHDAHGVYERVVAEGQSVTVMIGRMDLI